METKQRYYVKTPFYQYNSGAGDNGTYYPETDFKTEEKALQFKRIADAAFDASRDSDYDSFRYNYANKIVGEWFYGGYINGYSEVFHEIVTKEQLA